MTEPIDAPKPVEPPKMAEDREKYVVKDNYVSKDELDRMRAERDEAMEALRQTLEEVDTYKARVAELEPFQKQAGDLQAKARSLEAARAYDRIAGEFKIKPEFRDDVWKLAGYEPKGDEVDEKGLRDHLAAFLKERKAYTEHGDKEPTKFEKGEGAGRSHSDPGFGDGTAKVKVTSDQLGDFNWTRKPENKALISSGNYELVEA